MTRCKILHHDYAKLNWFQGKNCDWFDISKDFSAPVQWMHIKNVLQAAHCDCLDNKKGLSSTACGGLQPSVIIFNISGKNHQDSAKMWQTFVGAGAGQAFSPNRPTGQLWSSSRNVYMSICLYVPFPCDFFQGLSLAHRSHDQITGLSLVKKKIFSTRPKIYIYFFWSSWEHFLFTNERPGIWSCDLWANKRPQKKSHGKGTYIYTYRHWNY